MKKVSIIVLIFQVGDYVRQCLESILAQTYENIEVLCVVGNTDEVSMKITQEIAEKYTFGTDPKGEVIYSEKSLEGDLCVARRTADEEETPIGLELLFEAANAKPDAFKL